MHKRVRVSHRQEVQAGQTQLGGAATSLFDQSRRQPCPQAWQNSQLRPDWGASSALYGVVSPFAFPAPKVIACTLQRLASFCLVVAGFDCRLRSPACGKGHPAYQ